MKTSRENANIWGKMSDNVIERKIPSLILNMNVKTIGVKNKVLANARFNFIIQMTCDSNSNLKTSVEP